MDVLGFRWPPCLSVGNQLPKETHVPNFYEIYRRFSLMVYIHGLPYLREVFCLRECTLQGRTPARVDFSNESNRFDLVKSNTARNFISGYWYPLLQAKMQPRLARWIPFGHPPAEHPLSTGWLGVSLSLSRQINPGDASQILGWERRCHPPVLLVPSSLREGALN